MKCKVNNNVKAKIKDDFPKLTFNNSLEEWYALKKYFQKKNDIITQLIVMERSKKNNNNIETHLFFEELFQICGIEFNDKDKDELIKELLEGDYYTTVLKTFIPKSKYDLKHATSDSERWIVRSLIEGKFAIKSNFEIDKNKIYTPSELLTLQNQNKLVFLEAGNDHQINIPVDEYLTYVENYKGIRELLLPIDFKRVDRCNFINLMRVYPEIFEFLRKKIDLTMIDEAVAEYEDELIRVFNEEINLCDEIVNKYTKRGENIKSFRKML